MLYLDWEANKRDHAERLWGLTRSLEQPPEGAIVYRRMVRPLTDEIVAVRHDVASLEVDFVVCDSLGPASGPEPESNDAAVRTLMALRSLPTTTLAVAHMSKAAADAPGPGRPFGGVYVQNIPRSTIELRRMDTGEESELALTISHRKANKGALARPTGIVFSFLPDGSIVARRGEADLTRAPLSAQIIKALAAGETRVTGIAESLDVSAASVRTVMNRLESRNRVLRLVTRSGGKGQETEWGLRDTTRHTPPF